MARRGPARTRHKGKGMAGVPVAGRPADVLRRPVNSRPLRPVLEVPRLAGKDPDANSQVNVDRYIRHQISVYPFLWYRYLCPRGQRIGCECAPGSSGSAVGALWNCVDAVEGRASAWSGANRPRGSGRDANGGMAAPRGILAGHRGEVACRHLARFHRVIKPMNKGIWAGYAGPRIR